MPIEGKVARILNERDLVINKGADGGVKEGMKFAVAEPDVVIKEPDTGEALGSIPREKIRIRIVEVQQKYSIGKTYETFIDYVEPPVRFPLLPTPKFPVTRVRTLRRDNTTRFEPMDEESSVIKVGDPVIEVEDAT